jgi:hypothetical protein
LFCIFVELKLILTYLFCLNIFLLNSQHDSINFKSRKIILSTSSALVTTGSLFYLNQAWYQNYNTGKFHFFNDNKAWLQMDKIGHVYTNYQLSKYMMQSFEWAGFNKKQSLLIGGNIGLVYMTCIEIMDGYSDGWGFSWGDMVSNTAGTYLSIGQKHFFNEQKIWLKFSFSQSGLAQYNPSLLGNNLPLEILKDYNGQTYWLSFNPLTFKSDKYKNQILKMLNLSFGYSAYGMIGGNYNQFLVQNTNGEVLKLNRERRFYLSLDVDLTKIKTKHKALKTLFSALNCVKIPFPTLQFAKSGIRFYPLYF